MNLPILLGGDSLEWLKKTPAGSIDMIMTDPPYGMGYQSGYRKKKHRRIERDLCLIDWDCFSQELFRVCKDNTAHYIFTSFHNIDIFKQSIQKHFKIKNILVWEKNNTSMGDLKADFAPKVEFIIFFQKGRRLIEGSRDPNIMKFNRTQNKLHPTQKPVELCRYLISKFSKEGDLILDPFMGSGTSGEACTVSNRNFIGIEIDNKYLDVCKKRIGAHDTDLGSVVTSLQRLLNTIYKKH